MGVKVKTKAGSKAVAKKTVTKSAAAKSDGKRAAAKADVDKQRKDVAARLKKGEKFGDIAEALHVTPGRAKYLQMLNDVENGTVARISTAGNDEAVTKRIIAARDKQDEYSSWGWISARTGISEARVKALAEAGGHKVKGTHVAKERAAARSDKPAKGKTTAKKASAKNPSK